MNSEVRAWFMSCGLWWDWGRAFIWPNPPPNLLKRPVRRQFDKTRGTKTLASRLRNRDTEKKKMTQKGNLFKGIKKSKTIPPNRHGKVPSTRKGILFYCTILNIHTLKSSDFYVLWSNFVFLHLFFFFRLWPGKRFVKPSKVTKEMDADRVNFLDIPSVFFMHTRCINFFNVEESSLDLSL